LTGFFAPGAIVAEAFDFDPTSVGLKADRSQTRQITQPLAAGKLWGLLIVVSVCSARASLGSCGRREVL
jgi:hypothetical protein